MEMLGSAKDHSATGMKASSPDLVSYVRTVAMVIGLTSKVSG